MHKPFFIWILWMTHAAFGARNIRDTIGIRQFRPVSLAEAGLRQG